MKRGSAGSLRAIGDRRRKPCLRTPAAVLLLMTTLLYARTAMAVSMFVSSVGRSSVQVVVNGTSARSIAIGETTPEGITLKGIEGGDALFEVNGQVVRMTLGQTVKAASPGNAPGTAVMMSADGAFHVTVYINDIPLRALVDTGASFVSMSTATARQLGIDYARGRRGVASTANGPVAAHLVNLASVRLGEIALVDVPGAVSEIPGTIARDVDILLGNSFLQRVELHRRGSVMMIQRPY